jgi:hypothetical protein
MIPGDLFFQMAEDLGVSILNWSFVIEIHRFRNAMSLGIHSLCTIL